MSMIKERSKQKMKCQLIFENCNQFLRPFLQSGKQTDAINKQRQISCVCVCTDNRQLKPIGKKKNESKVIYFYLKNISLNYLELLKGITHTFSTIVKE